MSTNNGWYYAQNGQTIGPLSLAELVGRIAAADGLETLVYGPNLDDWVAARHVEAVAEALRGRGGPPRLPTRRASDEIDYEILGSEMQYVEITLDPGEMVLAEAGSMMFMTNGIRMDTVLGDPAVEQPSLVGKMLAAGKRLLTGESLFMTVFSNEAAGRQQVAFAAPYPGKVVPVHLSELGGEIICQKAAFLCAARGVEIGIALQKRLRTGLFGGEGFIMQRLTGDGLALLHAGGTLLRRRLEAGETLRLDTGCLVALTRGVDYDIQFVGGVKNAMFGGEGLFFATLTGPGEVWCQSLPFSRLVGRVLAQLPRQVTAGTGRRDRG